MHFKDLRSDSNWRATRDGRGNILFTFSKPAGHDLVTSLAGVQEAADLKARGRERFDCSILNN